MPTCLGSSPGSVAIRDTDQINFKSKKPNINFIYTPSFKIWKLGFIWSLVPEIWDFHPDGMVFTDNKKGEHFVFPFFKALWKMFFQDPETSLTKNLSPLASIAHASVSVRESSIPC